MTSHSKIALVIILSAMSGCLLWYSICTYKISGEKKPVGFGGLSAHFFPQAEVLNGNSKYFALDPTKAAEDYRKAILAEPSLIDAWIGLVRVQIASGNRRQASKTLGIIAPTLDSISTWKWKELVFAYELRNGPYFEKCFNYILSWLPDRMDDACWLASRFWGGWDGVAPHVFPRNYTVFLGELINWRQPDAAISLFKIMEEGPVAWKGTEKLRLCDFLISNNRLKEAKAVWRLREKGHFSLIYNGGFEKAPLNTAFGWRFVSNPDFIVERTDTDPHSGKWCLHVHFKGTRNIGCDLAYQLVPVSPGASYTLHFAQKSKNLTTDRGVFLQVTAYNKGGLDATGKELLGSSPWREEKIEFTVPAGCEAIVVHVRRDESLKFDSRISGDYWLDSVRMEATGNGR